MRPAVRLCRRDTRGPVGGWLGGAPVLPPGKAWPAVTGHPDRLLPLLATVDCAAVPTGWLDFPWPETGLLQFFMDYGWFDLRDGGVEEEATQVVHLPQGTAAGAARTDGPVHPRHDLHVSLRLDMGGYRPGLSEDEEEWDFLDEDLQDFLQENPHASALVELTTRRWEADPGDQDTDVDVVVGGFAVSAHSEPESALASEESARTGESFAEAEDRILREWVPLAQFGVLTGAEAEGYADRSDQRMDFARFMISRRDIAARRFESARSFSEFTG
ncbi:DUF1963 domain-containing protein [Actinoplanes sp. NPDC049548]|uniref:DUF1963 domain-containing protein n=1 Tax=Actinoplanes sp. NPDC049548 TaxID=3155152 RepID=UPI0034347D3E